MTVEDVRKQLINKELLIVRATKFLAEKYNANENAVVCFGPDQKNFILGKYPLAGDFLITLKSHGLEWSQRKDGIATLAGPEPEEKGGVTNAYYWNFRTDEKKDEQALTLELRPFLDERERGIIFTPHANGTYLSALDKFVNFKVFEAAADCDRSAHPLISEIIAGRGIITVHWTDIHLGGIRSILALFNEFRRDNEEIKKLGHSNLSPFYPNPLSDRWNEAEANLFLPEQYQPALFRLWQAQLESFQKSLTR